MTMIWNAQSQLKIKGEEEELEGDMEQVVEAKDLDLKSARTKKNIFRNKFEDVV